MYFNKMQINKLYKMNKFLMKLLKINYGKIKIGMIK